MVPSALFSNYMYVTACNLGFLCERLLCCHFNAWRDVKSSLSLYFCFGDTIKPVYLILPLTLVLRVCSYVRSMYVHFMYVYSKTRFLAIIEHAYTVAYDWCVGTSSTSALGCVDCYLSPSLFIYFMKINHQMQIMKPAQWGPCGMLHVRCAYTYLKYLYTCVWYMYIHHVTVSTCTCLYILYM